MSVESLGLIINLNDDQAYIFTTQDKKGHFLAKNDEDWFLGAWGRVIFENEELVSFKLDAKCFNRWNSRLEVEDNDWKILVDVHIIKRDLFHCKLETFEKTDVGGNIYWSLELGYITDNSSKLEDPDVESETCYLATVGLSLKSCTEIDIGFESEENTVFIKELQKINRQCRFDEKILACRAPWVLARLCPKIITSKYFPNTEKINKNCENQPAIREAISEKKKQLFSGIVARQIVTPSGACRYFIFSNEIDRPLPIVLYKSNAYRSQQPKVGFRYTFKTQYVQNEMAAVQLNNQSAISDAWRINSKKEGYSRTENNLLEIMVKMTIPEDFWCEITMKHKTLGEISLSRSLLTILLTNAQMREEEVAGQEVDLWFQFKRVVSSKFGPDESALWTADRISKTTSSTS